MKTKAKILIGTSGWTYSDWRGNFYPADLPQHQWFAYYAKHFSVIEINATTYRYFKDEVYKKWRDQAPANFRYILKVPRLVTHYKRLKNCGDLIHQFWRSTQLLENKFGLILLQLPPNFVYNPDLLANALHEFPDPKKVIVEFRNPIWHTKEVKDLLTELGSTFCIADSPATKLIPWVTSNIAYVRMHGRTKWFDYNYSYPQLRVLKDFVLSLPNYGAKKIFVMFNNDYYAYAIKNALYLEKVLKK